MVHHFNFAKEPIGDVTHYGGVWWTTPNLSPALMGIGYIIGPELASINASGGLIAWWILIPLLLFFDPDLPRRLGSAQNPQWDVAAYTLWFNIVRPIAVGTMLVGACYSLFSMRESIAQSVRGALGASRAAAHEGHLIDRTERDIPFNWLVLGTVVLTVAITGIYYYFTQSWKAAIIAAAIMSVSGFFLSAVGGYLTGLVGSSNQPLSGLTLSALVLSALVMLAIGAKGACQAALAAVLPGVASVVACAVSVSGSLIQDLKAGYLLGGTPWKMQVVEILSVILLSLFLMLPIIALHQANLATGGIGGRALPAPQAGLMAQLAKGIVGGQMAWGIDRDRRRFRYRPDLLRRPLAHADRCRHVSAVRHLSRHLHRRRHQVACQPPHRPLQPGRKAPRGRERHPARFRTDRRGEAIVGILQAVLFVAGASAPSRTCSPAVMS